RRGGGGGEESAAAATAAAATAAGEHGCEVDLRLRDQGNGIVGVGNVLRSERCSAHGRGCDREGGDAIGIADVRAVCGRGDGVDHGLVLDVTARREGHGAPRYDI